MRRCLHYGLVGAGTGLLLWVISYLVQQPPLAAATASVPVVAELLSFLGSPVCALTCGYFPQTQCQSTCWIAFGAILNIILGYAIGAIYGEVNCNHD